MKRSRCVGYMKGKLKQYSTVKSSAELVLRIQDSNTPDVWIGERRNGSSGKRARNGVIRQELERKGSKSTNWDEQEHAGESKCIFSHANKRRRTESTSDSVCKHRKSAKVAPASSSQHFGGVGGKVEASIVLACVRAYHGI